MAAAALAQAKSLMESNNYADANTILADLVSRGNTKATIFLSDNHFYGRGADQDRSIAYDILNNANERAPDIELIEHLCRLRLRDIDRANQLSEKEKNEFFEAMYDNFTYASLYESNDPGTYFVLGLLYETGTGTSVNLYNAQENYYKSLQLSLNRQNQDKDLLYQAAFHLGRLQLNYENTQKDGASNIISSADYINCAKVYAGRLYYEGKIIEKNLSKAFDLFKKAADMGIIEAQFYLAEMYEFGASGIVEQNLDKAIDLYFSVATVLANRGNCIIESLPPLATSPEYSGPIDKRAIEKIELYRPDLLSMLEKYKKICNRDQCTRTFTGTGFSIQHSFSSANTKGYLSGHSFCLQCAKKCFNNANIIDKGICSNFCDCTCHIKNSK